MSPNRDRLIEVGDKLGVTGGGGRPGAGCPRVASASVQLHSRVGRSRPSGAPAHLLLLQPEHGRGEETNSWGQAGKEDAGTLPGARRNRSCSVDVKPVCTACRGLTLLLFN